MTGQKPYIKETDPAEASPLPASSTQHMWELLAGNRTAVLPRHAQARRIMGFCVCVPLTLICRLEIVNYTVLLHKEFEIPTLRSEFFEILKFVFLSEVAHKSFWVKFSGLISKLKILKKSC